MSEQPASMPEPRPPQYDEDVAMGRALNAADEILFGRIVPLEQENAELRHEINHDRKTGLLSEGKFHEELEKAIEALQPGETLHVWVGDLNGFKKANDGLTHIAGDELLDISGSVLSTVFRREGEVVAHGSMETDDDESIARLGGDEFAGFWVNKPDSDPAHIQRTMDVDQASKVQTERFNTGMAEAVAGTKFKNYPITIAIGTATVDPNQSGDVKPGLAAFMQADAKMLAVKYADKIEQITPEDREYLKARVIPILDSIGHRVEDWLRDAVAAQETLKPEA